MSRIAPEPGYVLPKILAKLEPHGFSWEDLAGGCVAIGNEPTWTPDSNRAMVRISGMNDALSASDTDEDIARAGGVEIVVYVPGDTDPFFPQEIWHGNECHPAQCYIVPVLTAWLHKDEFVNRVAEYALAFAGSRDPAGLALTRDMGGHPL